MSSQQKVIKALHIIDGFGAGGAETWLLDVARYVQAHPEIGLQVDFLAMGGVPSIYDQAVLDTGAKIFYLRYSLKRFAGFRSGLLKILKAEGYDAIHNHQDFGSGWFYLLGLGAMPKVKISHLHNPYNFVHNYVVSSSRWLSFRVGRLLMVSLTDKITGTSDAVMDEYGYNKWPYKNKRVKPAYCGFDVSKFRYRNEAKASICQELGWGDDSKIGLFVGRIGLHDYDMARNQKNPEFALAVAKRLVRNHPDWKFIFVGFKGMLGEKMEAALVSEGLDDSIKFLGLRKDVHSLMSASDVLVFPSFWEGLGMVAVEAQAAGLPVVMSDTVPVEAIVVDELVTRKPLDEGEDAWSETLIHVAKAGMERTGSALKIQNSPFSIENSVAYLLQLYRS